MGDGAPDRDDAEERRSLLDDVRTLLEDGQIAIAAELNYQKSRLAFSARAGRNLAVFLVCALFFAFFTLIALTVGVLIALAQSVGAWTAAAIVTGSFLLLLLLCLLGALRCWRAIRAAFSGDAQ